MGGQGRDRRLNGARLQPSTRPHFYATTPRTSIRPFPGPASGAGSRGAWARRQRGLGGARGPRRTPFGGWCMCRFGELRVARSNPLHLLQTLLLTRVEPCTLCQRPKTIARRSRTASVPATRSVRTGSGHWKKPSQIETESARMNACTTFQRPSQMRRVRGPR